MLTFQNLNIYAANSYRNKHMADKARNTCSIVASIVAY